MIKYKLLADFKTPGAERMWEIVNGEVADSESGSRFTVEPNGTAVFEGMLSPDRDGGFASAKTNIGDLLLDGFRGMAVRIKGDGKSYQLCLGMEGVSEAFTYRAFFDTPQDSWSTLHIPFSKFVPFAHSNMAFFDPGNIRRIGLMTAERQLGAFRLEIEWIKAYLDY